MLKDNDLMPYGKYKGLKMQDIPASYFLKYEKSFAKKKSVQAQQIYNYILENKNVLIAEQGMVEQINVEITAFEAMEIDEEIDFNFADL